ncbi:2-hydroxyacid dehydrogenase [Pseudomonas plecoglossicida]|jgi:lactate dehydrogenase-like 2-hydroxyacid dehydrogenase|uniref:2-hydroxyacid dehydrogenase n=5 Tax=Pseudomonas TaxID=286 RepID=A0ABX4U8T6_PSEDL|nr:MULTISPECIES: 2-hydroxyacid dehydrogenase [Pseudomonas]KXK69418.1 2-hydroxyacid dehydrogenase [Pseudomonas monteilii]GJB85242.1 2-hydroxyacid dehydrogenase [Aeromonas caviae]AGA74581.1 D-isomer specific 2-hydroxyacid dehydrogenase NAD-binding protein [Pseudomonas putida HB3267]KPM62709.1 hydroxyacid dehydrogenase [Pseudomonas putida]MBO2921946.1 2-hydroxyacid dehydrogenase [Pseudomonas asiatica]
MHKTVLVLVETVDDYLPMLEQAGYRLIRAPSPQLRAEAIQRHAHEVDAVLTRGPLGLTASEIDTLSKLQIICVIGAGYEQVDLAAAAARGITVTNGAGANAEAVADHTLALLLALLRDIPRADASTRRGEWNRVISPSVSGKRLGILGLGAVGLAIARRAHLGFAMPVSYHSRTPRQDVPYTWYDSPQHLADAVDILVVATPGGANTRHLVDAQVLEALGAEGYLVNIARASVVDTQALVAALQHGQLAGAALDVFDDEPAVPDALKALGNTVLTPHVAGQSPEAARDTVTLVLRNLQAFFAGEAVLTPVRQ